MNQPELTLVLIGFGNVARRFVQLLGETADRLDFTWKVVAISTRHHGSVVDLDGIDTRRAHRPPSRAASRSIGSIRRRASAAAST